MRTRLGSPSIVPEDQTVYIVLDDFGANGRAYRETDADRADLEAVIMDMLERQYQNPVSVIGFNVSEAWSQDVSADVALEIRQRCDLQARDVPFYLEDSWIAMRADTTTFWPRERPIHSLTIAIV